MSALLHDYILYTGFGAAPGKHFVFFMLQGVAAVAEGAAAAMLPGVAARAPAWLGRVWAIGFTALTAPLMMDPILQTGYYNRTDLPGMWGPGVSAVAAVVEQWAGVCNLPTCCK
jgi:hypothetical protein